MGQTVVQIFRQANDANIGQTIRRLAVLAAAAHRYQTTAGMEDVGSDRLGSGLENRTDPTPTAGTGRGGFVADENREDFSLWKGQSREEGFDPLAVVRGPHQDADPLHTEVIR